MWRNIYGKNQYANYVDNVKPSPVLSPKCKLFELTCDQETYSAISQSQIFITSQSDQNMCPSCKQ